MFHGVGLYIFDRLITSLSCHTSVYVMHLSKKDLRSWLKGSLSWSKSECETVRPCIWCTSCLTTVSHLSQESLMLWLEANVSAYHQRIMIQNLLEHCWTEGLSFWKAIRPQVFSCVFLPNCLVTPCVFWQHSKDIECITSLPANTMETSLEHIANSQWNPVPILIFSIGN